MAVRVLRISSVFEVPQATLEAGGAGCDPVGGMQTHAAELTRTLDRHGLVQHVITARLPGAPAYELVGERAALNRVGLPVRRLRQLYSVPATPLAVALAREADLVHAHLGEDIAVLPIAALAARARRLPLVVTVHTSPRHTLRVVDARTALVHAVGGRCETWGLRRAAAVVTLTERLAALAAAHGVRAERISVVPSGVATRLLAPAIAERPDDPFPHGGRPRVLFLGRLAKQKGVETLVRAIPRLPATTRVLVVGDGPEGGVLEREAERLGVSERVHFAGLVARELVPAVFAHADVLAPALALRGARLRDARGDVDGSARSRIEHRRDTRGRARRAERVSRRARRLGGTRLQARGARDGRRSSRPPVPRGLLRRRLLRVGPPCRADHRGLLGRPRRRGAAAASRDAGRSADAAARADQAGRSALR